MTSTAPAMAGRVDSRSAFIPSMTADVVTPSATNRYGRTLGPTLANSRPSTALPPKANPNQTTNIIASNLEATRPSPGRTLSRRATRLTSLVAPRG
jgi:hypothetical protein